MDDSVHVLEFVPRLIRDGIIAVSWDYAKNDLAWGMFRPLYPAMAALIYLPGIWLGSTASYLWNALLAFAIIGAYCRLLATILRLPTSLLLLACASFFYAWDLLQHLSLQEKLVLSFGGMQVWIAWNRSRFSTVGFWTLFLIAAVLGFCSKSSIVIHFSVAIVAYVGATESQLKIGRKWGELLALMMILLLQVLLFAKISSTGSYTKQYDFAKVIPNLFSVQGAMLWVPTFLCLVGLVLHWRDVWKSPEKLVPVAGCAAFLALFLPWGIQAYVQSVAAPFFAAILVQLSYLWLRPLPRWTWVLPLCLLALSVATYRGLTMFGRLSDLGQITALGPELFRKGMKEIWMPCEEGSGAMQQFWKAKPEPTPEVRFLERDAGAGTRWVIYDQALCPFPGRVAAPDGCAVDLVWKGQWPKSYRLVMADCR